MHRWEDEKKYTDEVLNMWDKALSSVFGPKKTDKHPLEMELIGGPLDGRTVPNREKWVRGVSPKPDDEDQRLIVDEYERHPYQAKAFYAGRRRVEKGQI